MRFGPSFFHEAGRFGVNSGLLHRQHVPRRHVVIAGRTSPYPIRLREHESVRSWGGGVRGQAVPLSVNGCLSALEDGERPIGIEIVEVTGCQTSIPTYVPTRSSREDADPGSLPLRYGPLPSDCLHCTGPVHSAPFSPRDAHPPATAVIRTHVVRCNWPAAIGPLYVVRCTWFTDTARRPVESPRRSRPWVPSRSPRASSSDRRRCRGRRPSPGSDFRRTPVRRRCRVLR